MKAVKKSKKSEKRNRKGNMGLRRGEKGGGTKTETKRGSQRILIRNLKNKIIRLPDSKCQLREGKQKEGESVREIQKERGGKGMEWKGKRNI